MSTMHRIQMIDKNILEKKLKEAVELIKSSEPDFIRIYDELYQDKRFKNSIITLFRNNSSLLIFYTPNSADPLLDLAWYVYLQPWGNMDKYSGIPHYSNSEIWEKWFIKKVKNKKDYYGISENEDNEYFTGSVKIVDKASSMAVEKDKIIEYAKKIKDDIFTWSLSYDDKYTRVGGKPLFLYPLFNDLSLTRKKSFLVIDYGVLLFTYLQSLDAIEQSEKGMVIPKGIFDNRILGLMKQDVSASITYNNDNSTIELVNIENNSAFAVISMTSELADIEDEQEKMRIIDEKLELVRNENRTFANVNSRDFAGLSNIILFFKERQIDNILYTTWGELTEKTMKGLVSERQMNDKNTMLMETMNIVYKWSYYGFDFSHTIKGLTKRVHVLSFAQSDSSDSDGGTMTIELTGIISKTHNALLPDKNSPESIWFRYKDEPVAITIDALFLAAIEDDYINKQSTKYYSMLKSPRAKTIYGLIETIRKEMHYPEHISISLTRFGSAFTHIKEFLLIDIVDKELKNIEAVGAIADPKYNPEFRTFDITFR